MMVQSGRIVPVLKTIAIDLDATIIKYSGFIDEDVFGAPLPGAIEAIKWIADQNHNIIIFTARKDLLKVQEYLRELGIPFDLIYHKPPADVYIDDRAITFKGDWKEITKKLRYFKPWYQRRKII